MHPNNPDCRDLLTHERLVAYIKERYGYNLACADSSSGSFRQSLLGTAQELKRILEEVEGTYSHAKGVRIP